MKPELIPFAFSYVILCSIGVDRVFLSHKAGIAAFVIGIILIVALDFLGRKPTRVVSLEEGDH